VTNARVAAAAVAFAVAAPLAHARDEPLWEAGLGVAALAFPDYRGASQSSTYALPAPYFVYRGEIFKADRHGLRGIFFRTDRVDLNLSVGASLPVDSEDNRAREGMPDLRPSVEAGPSLDIHLWRTGDRRSKLDLRLPLRGAVTVESDPRYTGLQFFPHLNVDVQDPAGMSGWNLGMLAGPVFTDSRYNRYFYAVPREFATADRPAYEPGSGYAGMQFIVALSKRFPKFWVGGFARYDTLRGAAFEASPLVTSKRYAAGGIGISWILGESSQRVKMESFP
jgi:outer membrane scaffolding protein for murein synthesis (MipA/OmpV family)